MTEQGIAGCGSWFIVELDFREPGCEEPSRFRYQIYATTEDAAIRRAALEFRRITAVGRPRDVVAARCRRLNEPKRMKNAER